MHLIISWQTHLPPFHLFMDEYDIVRMRLGLLSIIFLFVIFIDVWAENSYFQKWERKEFSNENVTQPFYVI